MVVAGLGIGLMNQVYLLSVQNGIPRRMLGTGSALVQFSRVLGGSVGVALLGTIVNRRLPAGSKLTSSASTGELTGIDRAVLAHALHPVFIAMSAAALVVLVVAAWGIRETRLSQSVDEEPGTATEKSVDFEGLNEEVRMSIDVNSANTVEVGYDEFCGALAAHDLQALWSLQRKIMPDVPLPSTQPWLWKWDTVFPLAKRAGEIITIERGGDRRVLALANPGLNGLPFTSTTLWGAVQYLGPGESAPAAPSHAVRDPVRDDRLERLHDGRRRRLRDGGRRPDPDPELEVARPQQLRRRADGLVRRARPAADGDARVDLLREPPRPAAAGARPQPLRAALQRPRARPGRATTPIRSTRRCFATAGRNTERQLEAMHERLGGHQVTVEYLNPATGGPAIRTFSSEMTRLFPGARTPTRRTTGSSVHVVFQGSGRSVIDGTVFEWGPGDVFVVPSWAAVDHEASEQSDHFVISDRPVLEAFRLFRREELPEHQAVGETFQPR